MKIIFVLTFHLPEDERVWYHQAAALKDCGHEVFIISSKIEKSNLSNVTCFNDAGLPKRMVINKIKNILCDLKPEITICDNPISVVASRKYKRFNKEKTTIIYDVTERYPSSLQLKNINIFKKIIKFIALTFLSFLAGCFVDKFIFGEYYKSLFFRVLLPFKNYIYLPYFTNVEFVKRYPVQDISKRCELFYSGNLTTISGFEQVLKVAERCAEKIPETKFVLKIISSQNFDIEKVDKTKNVEIQFLKQLPFLDFCEEIGKSDIFLDLRKTNFRKKRSLPIKIFYYLAAGRPVIYSELKSVKKFFPKNELNNFGALVNQNYTEKIVEIIENYINNRDFYNKCCNFSYELASNKYHWNNIKGIFVDFINNND
jgi:glycosyltransferase involved in cell wall biosynthesis